MAVRSGTRATVFSTPIQAYSSESIGLQPDHERSDSAPGVSRARFYLRSLGGTRLEDWGVEIRILIPACLLDRDVVSGV